MLPTRLTASLEAIAAAIDREALQVVYKQALEAHQEHDTEVVAVNVAWTERRCALSMFPSVFPSPGPRREKAVQNNLETHCNYPKCTTLHGLDMHSCASDECKQLHHRSCAVAALQPNVPGVGTLCHSCWEPPDIEQVVQQLKDRMKTPMADWVSGTPIERLQLGYEEALAAVASLGNKPEDTEAVNAAYAREEAYIENLPNSGRFPKWFPVELRNALAIMKHSGLASLDEARDIAMEIGMTIVQIDAGTLASGCCKGYEEAVTGVYDSQLDRLRKAAQLSGPRRISHESCDYPDCTMGAVSLRECKNQNCGQKHHHVCANKAGQEDLSTLCNRCMLTASSLQPAAANPGASPVQLAAANVQPAVLSPKVPKTPEKAPPKTKPPHGNTWVTWARKDWERQQRATSRKQEEKNKKQRQRQKELNKEMKALKADLKALESTDDESMSDEDSLRPAFLSRDWRSLFAPVLAQLAPATETRSPTWHTIVPPYVREALPGLRFLRVSLQPKFLDDCRTCYKNVQQQRALEEGDDAPCDHPTRVMAHRALMRTLAPLIHDQTQVPSPSSTTKEVVALVDGHRQSMRKQLALEYVILSLSLSNRPGERFAASRMMMAVKTDLIDNNLPPTLIVSYSAKQKSKMSKSEARETLELTRRAARPEPRLQVPPDRKFSDRINTPDSMKRVQAMSLLAGKSLSVDRKQNAMACECTLAVAAAWLWEHPDAPITWHHVVRNLHAVAPDATMAAYMARPNFFRSPLGDYLKVKIGNTILPATSDGTPAPEEDPESVTARLEAAAIGYGDLWSLTAISMHMMPVNADQSPSDTPLYAIRNDNVDVPAALGLYHALCAETLSTSQGDLLSLKVRKPPSVVGGMAHFIYCLVNVDEETVIYHFDSLARLGDATVKTLADYSKRMAVAGGCSVAEMRIIRATALRRSMDLDRELKTCSNEALDWRMMPIPVCIPPMKLKQSWATCTFDVCVAEIAVLGAICVIDAIRLPGSMARSTYVHPRKPDGEREDCSYLQFLRNELVYAVIHSRLACVGGSCWPGSADDQTDGLPILQVSNVVLSLTDPAAYPDAALAEETPSQLFARKFAKRPKQTPIQAAETMAVEMAGAQAALASKSPFSEADGASRLQKGAQKTLTFQQGAYDRFAARFSGRNGLTDHEWLPYIKLMYPQASDRWCFGLMKKKDIAGLTEANDTCWVTDVSYRHPQMKSRRMVGGVRVPRDDNNVSNKRIYEAFPVHERPYEPLVPFVPNLGRVVSAVAFECSPGGSVTGQDQEGIEPETEVVLKYLPLVRMTKAMDNKTWTEVQEATPEVQNPTVFTLAIFQQRDDGVNSAVTSKTTSCRGGVLQVLCVEFFPAVEQTAPDKKGKPIKFVVPARVEFFAERMDALATRFWIDPMHFGSIDISRCCTPGSALLTPCAAPWSQSSICVKLSVCSWRPIARTRWSANISLMDRCLATLLPATQLLLVPILTSCMN